MKKPLYYGAWALLVTLGLTMFLAVVEMVAALP